MKTFSGRISMRLFTKELEELLEELQLHQVKQLLIRKAGRMPPDDRGELLNMLNPEHLRDLEVSSHAEQVDPAVLLAEISSFVEDLEKHKYCDGWGWDPDVRRERFLGDESWVEIMDDLLDMTGEAFLAGQRQLAAEAYGKLLNSFRLEHAFAGDGPDEMVQADIDEAKARYFRCLCEILPLNEQAPAIIDAMAGLHYIGDDKIGLQAMMDTDSQPVSGLEEMLPQYKRLLATAEDLRHGFWRHSRDWHLAEAARLSGGTEELAEMADRYGKYRPALYMEWIEELLRRGRTAEAADASKRGVLSVQNATSRADMADWLAVIRLKLEDTAGVLEARSTAFVTRPLLSRLRLLLAARSPEPHELAGYVLPLLDVLPDDDSRHGEEIELWLSLLAGKRSDAVKRLLCSNPKDWEYSRGNLETVFPFLLMAATGGNMPGPESATRELVSQASEYHDYSLRPTYVVYGRPDGAAEKLPQTLSEAMARIADDGASLANHILCAASPSLWRWLAVSLRADLPAETEREHYLTVAERVADVKVTTTVTGQHRGIYDTVALMVAACAEAHVLNGNEYRATELLRSVRTDFSRWNAFTRKLREISAASPLLPNELPKVTAGPAVRKARLNAILKAKSSKGSLKSLMEHVEPTRDNEPDDFSELLSTHLDELDLSVRAYNCLHVKGRISTVGELVTLTEMDLLRLRDLGRGTLKEIKGILADMGLELGIKRPR